MAKVVRSLVTCGRCLQITGSAQQPKHQDQEDIGTEDQEDIGTEDQEDIGTEDQEEIGKEAPKQLSPNMKVCNITQNEAALVHNIGRVCDPLWMNILDNDKNSQKQLGGCCTRILRAAFNRNRQQHELCSVMS